MCEFCEEISIGIPNYTFGDQQDPTYKNSSGEFIEIRKVLNKCMLVFSNSADEYDYGALDILHCPICGRNLVNENQHTVGLKIATNKPPRIECYIDNSRVNIIRLENKELKKDEIFNFELKGIMEFGDLNGIAHVMSKETFDKFCKLWKDMHNSSE